MARRAALLHYAFASTLIAELGEEQGLRLVEKAIHAYGMACGQAVRAGVEAQGLSPTPENFNRVRDLPAVGWETTTVTDETGVLDACTFCPLADTWTRLGPEARRLGRLYCRVDQAKQEGYNPDYEYMHLQNVLDGDPMCVFAVRPRS